MRGLRALERWRVASSSMGVTLGIEGTTFTLDGKPTFLLGISYYGALGAEEATLQRDLDAMGEYGFNWLRVWATWTADNHDVSAVEDDGSPREPFLSRLKRLVEEANERRMVVDVTLTRGATKLLSLEAHRRAVVTLAEALKPYRNVYFDVANERNVRDERHVPYPELATLRDAIKAVDPERLVTASHAGDLTAAEVVEHVRTVRVDFLAPHRPRHINSPVETRAKTVEALDQIRAVGKARPLHYQEPFRRDYDPERWNPVANDFLQDLLGAQSAGAAGWCFHNGDSRNNPERRPRRSFDLREGSLFDQLDAEERTFLQWLKTRKETHGS